MSGCRAFEATVDAGVPAVPAEMYSLAGSTSGYIAPDHAEASEARLRKAFSMLKQVMMQSLSRTISER